MKSTTLPHAFREIERLSKRVQELELELELQKQHKVGSDPPVHQLDTPSILPIVQRTSDDRDPDTRDPRLTQGCDRMKMHCEGIYLRTARSPQKTWYGSSSIFCFIGRINAFLTLAFQQTHSAQGMLPNAASKLLNAPTSVPGEGYSQVSRLVAIPVDDPINAGDYLTPTQEEYFLGLFWQTYNTSCPILDELEFKEHYQSLWAAPDGERKPSALVDIVLAVCIQYGMAQLPGAGRGPVGAASRAKLSSSDATIAGRWHYRRSQVLLSSELESPTLSTLRCHILSCIYLCNGSFQNMADNTSSLAVRTAYMLGLHLESPQTTPRRERELRKRLWWTVFAIETKMSMKLGRPFLIHASSATCSLPADDREIAVLSGSNYAPPGENVTWLTWSLHYTKLMLTARAAYMAFYENVPNTLSGSSGEIVSERLNEWLKGVPGALKTKRQSNGDPFSTDLSAVEIEQFAPLWLQQQRLLLELIYHNLCTNLYRPFISFPSATALDHLPDKAAVKCAAHAMALTQIMHQVLLSTSILDGWYEAFQWQWNATMTIVGYVLAYPSCALTRKARHSIDLSIAVFEKFGDSFAVAASAADIMRDLRAKVDFLMEQNQGNLGISMQLARNFEESSEVSPISDNSTILQAVDGLQDFDSETTAEITGVLGESIDILAVEPHNDFEWQRIHNNFPDQWEFTQQYLQDV